MAYDDPGRGEPGNWFDGVAPGDFVKVRVGNERLWFKVLEKIDQPSNAAICEVANTPVCGAVFEGRTTIDRDWIVDVQKASEPPAGGDAPR